MQVPLATSEGSHAPVEFSEGRPIVFRGATLVTMDPQFGVLADADVLVVDTRIEAVGRQLPVPEHAAVVEAGGAILLPGFVDTHRHTWQSALRGIGVDWTITDYVTAMLGGLAAGYRTEDIYAGNYIGMVEAVHDGVTTVMDWSHALVTPEHADAAVDALFAAPGRARFGYGNALAGHDQSWVLDGRVEKLQQSRFAGQDQLVTMQLALDFPRTDDGVRRALDFARDHDLPVSLHAGVLGMSGDEQITDLAEDGYLSPAFTLVHGGQLTEASFRRIADAGANLSIAAESEMNAGQGYPPTGAARRHGVELSLSMDTVVWISGDMFSAMRATLSVERVLRHLRAHERGEAQTTNELRAADVLEFATMGGARALGMADRIGSITPGKAADLVMLRTDTPAMFPVRDPIGHVVYQAGRGDIDTVMVNGTVLRHRGDTRGIDLAGSRRLAEESWEHLQAAAT